MNEPNTSLRHSLLIRFAEVFPDIEIVSALRTQLGWTHFKAKVFAHAVTCKSQGEEIGYE